MKKKYWQAVLLLMVLVNLGCQGLTQKEAVIALEESALSNQAATLIGGTIEISTHFTLGQAVEAAAQELQAFVASQLPCAELTLEGATLTVEYGVNEGNCTFHGQTYIGKHIISITSADSTAVVVDHRFENLANLNMTLSGTAQVTWSDNFKSRHIVHDLQWTRLWDKRKGSGSGDRVQQALDDNWQNGIIINGERSWDGKSGYWELTIDNVQARWEDPVPQSGKYKLETPFDKSATLSFERVDKSTIAVTLKSGKKTYSFHVNKLGEITSTD